MPTGICKILASMKKWQIISLVSLSAVCLLAAYLLMILGKANMHVLAEIQDQKSLAARVTMMRNFMQSLNQDIAKAAATDPAMASLLVRHGYGFQTMSAPETTSLASNTAPTPVSK
jgi:hypothetical protein